MPSQLVDDVRALIRKRAEEGRPVTDLERTFLLAALAHRVRDGEDVVDELEAAIAHARRTALTAEVPTEARRAITRLLAAARAALDYTPAAIDHRPPDPDPPDPDVPRRRADLDG